MMDDVVIIGDATPIFEDLSLPTESAHFILVEYQETPDLPRFPDTMKKRPQFKCDGTMKKRRFKP
jgi:hypothetical protein